VETTIAFTPQALGGTFAQRHELLGPDWLAKWRRSAARIPDWLAENEREDFERTIQSHPQFVSALAS